MDKNHILSHENSILTDIVQKTKTINALNGTLYKILPQPLNQHCRVANIRNKCLVIEIDSPNWATKIRFIIPELLHKMQKKYPNIAKIEWYICRPHS